MCTLMFLETSMIEVTFKCGNKVITDQSLDEYIEEYNLDFSDKLLLDVTKSYFDFFQAVDLGEYLNNAQSVLFINVLRENKDSSHRLYGSERELLVDYSLSIIKDNVSTLDVMKDHKLPEIRNLYLITMCCFLSGNKEEELYFKQFSSNLKSLKGEHYGKLSTYKQQLVYSTSTFGWSRLLMNYIKKRNPSIYGKLSQYEPRCEKLT